MTAVNNDSPKVAVILAAGGVGERLGAGIPKAFASCAGKTLLETSVAKLKKISTIKQIVVALPAGWLMTARQLVSEDTLLVTGGATRGESIANALQLVDKKEITHILTHDVARCFTPEFIFENIISALKAGAQAVVPVLTVTDTVKVINVDGVITGGVPRDNLRLIQTPQGFTADVLRLAYATGNFATATDDSSLVSETFHSLSQELGVTTIPGTILAHKITTATDLAFMDFLVRNKITAKLF